MATSAAAIACRPPFTAAQWAELEHQALIFKYMMAGMPIPPELILPIHRSFEAMAARLYHHPTLGYCSYYGKKLDPEPGRCRRTDGKKWRCAKDAYQDSKYCERHMHRGRNRSRKPVEAQPLSQSPSSSVTSLAPAGRSGGSSSGDLQGVTLAPIAGEAGLPRLLLESGSYGMDNKDFRYLHGVKTEADEQSFFTETTGSAKSLMTNSSLDSRWRVVPSSVPRNGSVAQSTYPQLQSLQDFGHGTVNLMPKQQHQSFFRNEFASSVTTKHETQSLRPFFDEWPKARDSWSDLDEDKANHTSFSTTQLSISIPMTSSDFSATSSRSPNDVDD